MHNFKIANYRNITIPLESEILFNWSKLDKPLLSILCITYNQDRFIEDAIRGFLIQKTTFPFEIILHDDASNDATVEIIKRYSDKYPKIIKPIFQTVNQFSQGNKDPFEIAYKHAQGKYIATCEGDDFWLDNSKLEKQVSFLENNPDFVISFHDAFLINENDQVIGDTKLIKKYRSNRTEKQLQCLDSFLPTMSWVFRKEALTFPDEYFKVLNKDSFSISCFGLKGRAKFHSEILPAAYRVHSNGIWSSLASDNKKIESIHTLLWLYRFHKRSGNSEAAIGISGLIGQLSVGYCIDKVLIREFFMRIFKLRELKKLFKNN